MSDLQHEIIICDCMSPEHQIIIVYDNEDELCYLRVHLQKYSFWKRLKYGLLYIFGRQCNYGAFDEIILTKDHAYKFYKLYEFLNNIKN